MQDCMTSQKNVCDNLILWVHSYLFLWCEKGGRVKREFWKEGCICVGGYIININMSKVTKMLGYLLFAVLFSVSMTSLERIKKNSKLGNMDQRKQGISDSLDPVVNTKN